jgi:hypothetical protein
MPNGTFRPIHETKKVPLGMTLRYSFAIAELMSIKLKRVRFLEMLCDLPD